MYEISLTSIPVFLETINKNFLKFSILCGIRKLSPLWTYKLLTFLSVLMIIGEILAFII